MQKSESRNYSSNLSHDAYTNGSERFLSDVGSSFEDSMRHNMPSNAHKESPKVHRKNHHHTHHNHHHHHHHHHKRSSAMRNKGLESLDAGSFLFRSYSESSLDFKDDIEPKHRAQTADVSYLHYLNSDSNIGGNQSDSSSMNSFSSELDELSRRNGRDRYSLPPLLTTDKSSTLDNLSMYSMLDRSNNKYEENLKLTNGALVGQEEDEKIELQSLKARDNLMLETSSHDLIQKEEESMERIIAKIDKYLNMCHLNYEHVESQINITFSKLSSALNYRRKTLIDEAKLIRDRKIKSLSNTKMNCIQTSQTKLPDVNDVKDSSHHPTMNGCIDHLSLSKANDVTEYCGISEPWNNESHMNNKEVLDDDVADSLKMPKNILSEQLEEGNMTFNFDDGEIDVLNTIGNIKENLSSPQYSFTKGLSQVIAIVGDKIDFEVYTRDINNSENFNPFDTILVRIYDCDKKKVPVEAISMCPRRRASLNKQDGKKTANTYTYSFTSFKPGLHEISIKLNDVEISSSPFSCLVYSKLNLKFDSLSRSNERREFSDIMSQASNGGEDYSSDSEEDPFDSTDTCILGSDWIVQTGGKSSLLRSLTETLSDIYATDVVKGLSAWQIRVTSACMNIVLLIGVKTRSGIPDLDEQFACEFHMDNCINTASSLDKVNYTVRRKSSMFTRLSTTFSILLNDGMLRVTCQELNEDKRIAVNIKRNSFDLYPFCSMSHCHKEATSQVCPMPQITFL